MYVETDFLVALLKDEDWLGESVEDTLRDDDIDVYTSLLSYLELLLSAYTPDTGIGFEVVPAVSNLLDEVPINPPSDEDVALAAATFLDEYQITPFDAFHAGIVVTRNTQILASDRIYDEVGLDRVQLEPESR